MKNNKQEWEVLSMVDRDDNDEDFDEDDYSDCDYEISVIRKSNIHGHKSFGWGHAADKIILFDPQGNELGDELDEETIDWAKKVAQKFCDVLNDMERVE